MFKDAYSTTPCSAYQIKSSIDGVQRHMVMDNTQCKQVPIPGRTDGFVKDLWMVTPGLSDIPPFAHPLVIPSKIMEGVTETFIDVRNFTRLTRDDEVVVSASMDYELSVLRGFFQSVWNRGEYMDMLNLGHYQITIFARWLSEALTRRLALDPEIQMRVTVLAAYFYLCMFNDQVDDELEDKTMLRYAAMIARSTYVNADDVIKIIEPLPFQRRASDFCRLLEEHGESARFEKFNVGLLYTIISGSWFGSNARELAAVAVEHPPTWLAMLCMATNERGYRNTVIGKLAQQYQKADEVRSFLFNIKQLQN